MAVVRSLTAVGERTQAALRYAPRADAPARTAADTDARERAPEREAGPSR